MSFIVCSTTGCHQLADCRASQPAAVPHFASAPRPNTLSCKKPRNTAAVTAAQLGRSTRESQAANQAAAPMSFVRANVWLGSQTSSAAPNSESSIRCGTEAILASSPGVENGLCSRVVNDHRQFYSPESLTWLGGGLAVGAAIANASSDQGIYTHFQTSVRGATSDEWSETLHANKELGNGIYTLPVMATVWAAGECFDAYPAASAFGHWGERSLRSFLVGVPPVLVAQRLTGGSRPGETDHESRWRPTADENGVSGHSFMSALPFINAAKMTDNSWAKTGFYAASLLGPLSRINDEAHYPSQVGLGWWFAYLAATAVDHTEGAHSRFRVQPYYAAAESGAFLEYRF